MYRGLRLFYQKRGENLFNYAEHINNLIRANVMTEKQFFELEIRNWKSSKIRKNQIVGEKYYNGEHDILNKKRTVIGKDGMLQEVENLPNNCIVDNQYAKMVDQKTNYLLGKPISVQSDNKNYEKALKTIFCNKFNRLFQNIGESSINNGIS